MNRLVPISVLALALAAGACRSPQYVSQRDMPARGPSDAPQQPTLERHDGFAESSVAADSSTEPLQAFCERITTVAKGRKNLGCLPLVSVDPRAQGPWVSEYGVDVADQVAGMMRARGFATTVLTTTEMGTRLDETLGARATLSSLETVRRHGEHLGVELAVFGTIRRDNSVGRSGRDVLTVDLQCYDFVTQQLAARSSFEVPSDDARNARIWRLVQRTSSWSPDVE